MVHFLKFFCIVLFIFREFWKSFVDCLVISRFLLVAGHGGG